MKSDNKQSKSAFAVLIFVLCQVFAVVVAIKLDEMWLIALPPIGLVAYIALRE